MQIPFFDPTRTYEENYQEGPFGAFADGKIVAEDTAPTHTFLGIPIHRVFGIPAGPLLNGRFVKAALDKGFDLATYKTVRTAPQACHRWPNVLAVEVDGDLTLEKAAKTLRTRSVYEEPLSITNSFGVPSFPPDVWQQDMADAVRYARPGQAVIGSFQGTKRENGDVEGYIGDFVLAAKLVKETGASILEVNLSCPNEGTNHLLCFDVARARKIVEAIKNEIGDTPLILKMAYFADADALREFARTVGPIADALSAINTIAAEIRNPDGNQALPG